jgi:CDP-glycerol glycerophosphotransferase (TagB/SpsB family)
MSKMTNKMKSYLHVLLSLFAIRVAGLVYLIFWSRSVSPRRIAFISYPDAADNALAMFYFLQKGPEHHDIVWLVKKKTPSIAARLQGARVVRGWSLGGMVALATARLVLHTHGLPRYAKRRPGQIIVNLWHGMPLKKIGALLNDEASVPVGDYAIATSELFRGVLAKAFQMPSEKVLLTGQPRNDRLLQASRSAPKMPLWMPTFRHSLEGAVRQDSLLSPDYFVRLLREVDAKLAARDLRITIKLHPMDVLNTLLSPDFRAINVIFGQDQRQTVEDLLAASSALITDYSSAAIDFLVLQRPIGYFCPDLDQYCRGYIDAVVPAYFAAGTMLRDPDALIDFIARPARPAMDRSEELVLHRDGRSAERLWQQLQALEGLQ